MKKWFLYLCLVVAPVFFACSDDDEEGEDEKFVLTVDKEKLEFEAGETESFMERIRITTNAGDWTAVAEIEGENKWFTATKKDHQLLEVVTSVNTSLEKREGKILIKAEGCQDKEIAVLQSAAAEATLELSKENSVFGREGGEENIVITSNQANIRLEDIEEAEWFSVELAADNKSFKVKVKEAAESAMFMTKFKVIAGTEGNQKEIEFTVKQVDAVVLNATGYRVILDVPDGLSTVKSGDESWCTAKLENGKLSIEASGNVGGSGRNTTVIVGEDLVINVEQEGGEFNPGDVFKHNGVAVGIVVCHDEDGLLILGLKEKEDVKFCVAEATAKPFCVKVKDPIYAAVRESENWKENFPAFAFCAEMDEETGMEGWHLPSYFYSDMWSGTITAGKGTEWHKTKVNYKAVQAGLEREEAPKYNKNAYWCDGIDLDGWGFAWDLEHNQDMGGFAVNKPSSDSKVARCFWWMRDLKK
ncbi:hypothetical protein [Butyricimonas synergistica]|uniref:hypothetical protein n=1 Tax=Butyricimonas synergistica TaxID=544644 RepID=UPI0022E71680|nr:hypothetical protein [Butyricimonas synergistica]